MKKSNILMLLKSSIHNDSRVIKEATSLTNNGYNVTVVYSSDKDVCKDYVFKIRRIKKYPESNVIILKFLFHFLKLINILFIGIKIKPDVCHVHDLNTLIEGFLIAFFSKSKLVYDSHELFYATSYKTKFMLNFCKRVEKLLSNRIDAIITVSKPISKKIIENIGKKKKVIIVRNCVEKHKIKKSNVFRKMFPELENRIILLAQGIVAPFKFDDMILEAINKVENVALVILGNIYEGNIYEGYKDEFLRKIHSGVKNKKVYYLNAVDRDMLLHYTASADIGLILHKNVSLNNYFALPNRLFEYISCGLPILSTDMLEIKRIIKKYGLGETYEYGSKESFLSQLKKIINAENYKEYCENSKKAFEKYLNWEREEEKLFRLYRDLIMSHSGVDMLNIKLSKP